MASLPAPSYIKDADPDLATGKNLLYRRHKTITRCYDQRRTPQDGFMHSRLDGQWRGSSRNLYNLSDEPFSSKKRQSWTCRLFPIKNIPAPIPSPFDDLHIFTYQRDVANRRRSDAAAFRQTSKERRESPPRWCRRNSRNVNFLAISVFPVKSISQSVSQSYITVFIMLIYCCDWLKLCYK